MNQRNTDRGDALPAGKLSEIVKRLPRRARVAGKTISVPEMTEDKRAALGEGKRFVELGDGLRVHGLLFARDSEPPVSSHVVLVDLERLLELFRRLLLFSLVEKVPTEVSVDDGGQGFQPQGFLTGGDRIVKTPHCCQVHAVLVVCQRRVWSQLNGPIEFFFGSCPIPIEEQLDVAHCDVRFGEGIVDLERL